MQKHLRALGFFEERTIFFFAGEGKGVEQFPKQQKKNIPAQQKLLKKYSFKGSHGEKIKQVLSRVIII